MLVGAFSVILNFNLREGSCPSLLETGGASLIVRHEVGHNVGPNVSTNDTPRPDLTLHATMNNRPALPHRNNVSNICLNRLTATLSTTDIAVAGGRAEG